jgi:PII-like signaling protein
VVETREKIDSILPKVDEMIDSGLITLEKVNVIRYTHRHEGE